MSVYDDVTCNPERYDETIDDSDLVEVDRPSSFIKFVFKQDLTEEQKKTFSSVCTNFRQGQQESNRVFNFIIDLDEGYGFLESQIPYELANLLCYVECSDNHCLEPPTIFFKSELLVRRSTLLNRVNSEVLKPKGRDLAELYYYNILNPILFNTSPLREGQLDVYTAEMIASHFFFNPKIVMSTHNNGVIVSYSWCQEDEIISAYNNTQKIIAIDESQKVKMYGSNTEAEEEIGNIETWLEKSRAYYICVKSATDDSVHGIFIIICHDRLYLHCQGMSYSKYRILAFT